MSEQHDVKQDVTLAILKTDMEYLKREVGGIGTKLDILEKNYVKSTELESFKDDADDIHKTLAATIKAIELDLAVFKTQIKTWGAAAVLALGISQFVISLILK